MKWTVPVYPVAALLKLSRAVTVTDPGVPAITEEGKLVTAKVLAAASAKDRENYESHVMAKVRDTLMHFMLCAYLAGKPELEQLAVET